MAISKATNLSKGDKIHIVLNKEDIMDEQSRFVTQFIGFLNFKCQLKLLACFVEFWSTH